MNKNILYKLTTLTIITFAIAGFALPSIMTFDSENQKYNPWYINQNTVTLAIHLAFLFFFLFNYFSKSKLTKTITSIVLLLISLTYLFFAIQLRTKHGKEMYGGSGIVVLGCLFPLTIIYFYLKQQIKYNGK